MVMFVAVQVLGWECRQKEKNSLQDKGKRMLKRLAIDNNNNLCFPVHKINNLNCNLVSKIGNFMRSMSCLQKRKIRHERRMFNNELFVKYFVVQQNERALCLICRNNITCLKEFNIKRNYNSRHSEQYKGV